MGSIRETLRSIDEHLVMIVQGNGNPSDRVTLRIGLRPGVELRQPVVSAALPPGVYRIGGGVSAPVPIVKPEPEYSQEARAAKWQGAVLLQLVVDENGVPQDIRVVRSLGLGLDQKAIEAVQQWRFKPGLKDGNPVPTSAIIEVNFRLAQSPL
jgi:TonB family protein